MKLSFTTADFDEATWIEFAKFLGWKEQVMTTTESPNYLIDNTVSYKDYIINKYGEIIFADLANFNISQVKEQVDIAIATANQTLADAKYQAEQEAKTLITAVID
jgi:hypothetical protein